MAAQIAGNTIGNILEIEAATKAARVVLRPEDYGSLGIYSLAASNGASARWRRASPPPLRSSRSAGATRRT
jgi:hypothetical protein